MTGQHFELKTILALGKTDSLFRNEPVKNKLSFMKENLFHERYYVATHTL